MATKKDLVEAYAFSRRRLVTAFLSGAPGGREVEPSRPGRTIIGGIALAVLLVAAAAIASVLASKTEEDWNKVGLVVSREEAAPYVILKEEEHPTLIPVINITSAQLILGADVEPTYVDQDVIEDQTPGEPIGIFGAPQTLPRPRQFINSGWTACTDHELGLHLDISADSLTSDVPDGGVVVESKGAYYVVATSSDQDPNQRAYRYPLPALEEGVDSMLVDLHLNQRADAMSVPEAWVRLFPDGGTLGAESFDIEGWGEKVNLPALPRKARVGDLIVEDDQAVVLTKDGPSPLDPFARAVYANSLIPPNGRPPRVLPIPIPTIPGAGRAYDDAHWPETLLDTLPGPACARLVAEADEVPRALLVGDPQDEAAPDESSTTRSKPTFSIDRGHGAFFRVGEWNDTTSSDAFVVDPRGVAYPLLGSDTLTKLGYDDVGEPLVPDTWAELFKAGVALSTSSALCPPLREADQVCQEPGG
jgi:type VII secretion protein EccB